MSPQDGRKPQGIAVDVGALAEFTAGAPRGVRTAHGTVLIYCQQPGDLRLWLGICPHMGNHLRPEDCQGDRVHCTMHQWEFNLRTGANLDAGYRGKLTKLEHEVHAGRVLAYLPPE